MSRSAVQPPPLIAAVIAALLAVTSPVHAQDASGVATELFNAGRDLMKAGDYRTACPKLAESARLDAKVGTLARLAECEEKIGHFMSARSRWEQAVNVAMSQHDDRLPHVRSELARLDAMVPKIAFSVEGATPADLRLRIDDLEVGVASVGVPLPVEAGSHHIVASAPGKKPWSTELVTQANGGVVSVRVPPLPDDVAAVVPVVPSASPAAPARGMRPLRVAGLVTGAAVVGVGIGAAFAAIAIHKNTESNQQPGGCDAQSSCPASAYTLRNDARTAGDVSTGLFVAGGRARRGGLVMWLVAPRESGAPSVSVAPAVGLRSGSIGLEGAF